MKTMPQYDDTPWWWRFADPAPPFLKYLTEEEIRIVISANIDNQINAIKRQQMVLQGSMEDLKAQEKTLTQVKTAITAKR